jgi:hypothetical protein
VPLDLKYGSLKLQEPSGPLQACNGIALPLTCIKVITRVIIPIITIIIIIGRSAILEEECGVLEFVFQKDFPVGVRGYWTRKDRR